MTTAACLIAVVIAIVAPKGWAAPAILTLAIFYGVIAVFPEYWAEKRFWGLLAAAMLLHLLFVIKILRPPTEMRLIPMLIIGLVEGVVIIFGIVSWAVDSNKIVR